MRLTHFKVDVGSNDYRDCSDVILFGLHHAPRSAHLGRALSFTGQKIRQGDLDSQTSHLTGEPREVQEGDYAAQIKQLGARGRVRKIDDQGRCGQMRLWIYQNDVPPETVQSLFPGCRMKVDPSAFGARHGVARGRKPILEQVVEALAALPETAEEIDLRRLSELIGSPP